MSRQSSVDSLIGDLPTKFDKNNLDNIDNDDQDKLNSIPIDSPHDNRKDDDIN